MSQTNIKEKLQMLQQKTTNLPTIKMSQTNIKEKLQIFQQKTTNLPTMKLSKIKPIEVNLVIKTIFNSMPLSIPG